MTETELIIKVQASSLVVDFRESTQIIMSAEKMGVLDTHVGFMLEFQKNLFKWMSKHGKIEESYYNDTGDGVFCAFWDKNHSQTTLKIILEIYQYLDVNLPKYVKKVKEKLQIEEMQFGIGAHFGKGMVARLKGPSERKEDLFGRQFFYGIVANSTSRLESFSKNYMYENFLISGEFRNQLIQAQSSSEDEKEERYFKILEGLKCLGEVDLKDSKVGGHWAYSIGPFVVQELLEHFGIHRLMSSKRIGEK